MDIVRFLIADDHEMLSEVVAEHLEAKEGFKCVGILNNGKSTLERLKSDTEIDVVLLDFAMPIVNGLEVLKELKDFEHNAKLIVLSSLENPIKINRAMEYGASGFVNKCEKISIVFEAIEKVLNEEIYISPLGKKALQKLYNPETQLQFLTFREQEVLELMLEGDANQEIADKLFLSLVTIIKHRQHLMKKLDVNSTTALYKKIRDLGWL